MKIGIISDIHNNLIALQAVLTQLKELHCDEILCCGDILGLGPYPEETVATIIDTKNITCVLGNHDRYYTEKMSSQMLVMSDEEIKHHLWEHSRLSQRSKIFLEELPLSVSIHRENKGFLVQHYGLSDGKNFQPVIASPSAFDFSNMYAETEEDVVLFGHDHRSQIFHHQRSFMNFGSLGCPVNGKGIAKFGIINIGQGKISYDCLEINYDLQQVLHKMDQLNYPGSGYIKRNIYGIK